MALVPGSVADNQLITCKLYRQPIEIIKYLLTWASTDVPHHSTICSNDTTRHVRCRTSKHSSVTSSQLCILYQALCFTMILFRLLPILCYN
ncbi:uncharacterized protein [Epargyreus clarus]|uniref:uncharacterized protein n=1 Tax=Epargyreus clarus TaxID=520877 RepID=UPI003C2EA886